MRARRTCAAGSSRARTADGNPNNYLVATQDVGLRAHLRAMGSVPIVYLQLNTMLLEPPSEASLKRAKEVRPSWDRQRSCRV